MQQCREKIFILIEPRKQKANRLVNVDEALFDQICFKAKNFKSDHHYGILTFCPTNDKLAFTEIISGFNDKERYNFKTVGLRHLFAFLH